MKNLLPLVVIITTTTLILLSLAVGSDALTVGDGVVNRRNFVVAGTAATTTTAAAAALTLLGAPAVAADTATDYVKTTSQFAYAFQPPSGFDMSNKPLKTHLEEINFISSDTKGYQFGITVDPVRISSLKEFGSPEEVAARVVLAEVNRDGVFDVTLVKDPLLLPDSGGSYLLDYLSQGKRGNKHFVCQISIDRQKLYVLTAQVKEENYAEKEKELFAAVDTFRVTMADK